MGRSEIVVRRTSWIVWVALVACEPARALEADEPPPQHDLGAPAAQPHQEAMVAEPAVAPRSVQRDLPATTVPLTLLATMASSDPELGRATVRDDEAAVIATYRVGESIRPGVRVVAVTEDHVALEHDGRSERLSFDVAVARVQADDVFYPDLAHFEDLSTSMADGVQLEDGPGYVVKTPALAWGTPRTVQALRQGLRAYARAHPDAPDVHVGDLSRRTGGPLPPHVSHQSGRDIDIGYVLAGPSADARRFIPATARNIDAPRSLALLRALLDTGEVAYVFMNYEQQSLLYDHAVQHGMDSDELATIFQYPRGRRAMSGIVRHWKGHDDHFHVRMKK